MSRRVTLFDIADALGVSTGTVHRALHDHPGVNSETKARVLQVSKEMGYQPNVAARLLSQNKHFRISVNTLKGTTSFWDEVRSGILDESQAPGMHSSDLEFRTFPSLGEGEKGEREAFEEALAAECDGIILFPSHPHSLRSWMRRTPRPKMPVVCVSTDAPETGRLAVVSVDTMASGALAADLMGRFLGGRGKVAVTLSALAITEHAEKLTGFQNTLAALHPTVAVLDPIEDHDVESEAYDKCRKLFAAHPDLAGIYVTTEASMPVIRAAEDAQILDRLTIITTDLFPDLIEQMRKGRVSATIYQRPRAQGKLAFRLLQEFLMNGKSLSSRVTLAPHLILRGNLDFFLEKHVAGNGRVKAAAVAKGAESNPTYPVFD
jgi:LacI family transcriptional regulator